MEQKNIKKNSKEEGVEIWTVKKCIEKNREINGKILESLELWEITPEQSKTIMEIATLSAAGNTEDVLEKQQEVISNVIANEEIIESSWNLARAVGQLSLENYQDFLEVSQHDQSRLSLSMNKIIQKKIVEVFNNSLLYRMASAFGEN